MKITVLLLSLTALLAALLLSLLPLLAVSVVSVMVALAGLRLKSRLLLTSFWVWLNLVLAYLWSLPLETDPQQLLVLGLPVPAFWMLAGIWLVPVVIWPLGFALGFEEWSRE